MVTQGDAIGVSLPAPAPAQPHTAERPLRVAHGRPHVHKPRGLFDVRLHHLLYYRRLMLHFGWIYIARKFRGTWLGWLWIPLRPTIDMLSRGLVFGGFLAVGSGDRPYLIFLMVGSSAWTFFDRAAYWGFRGLTIQMRTLGKTQISWLTAVVSALIPAAVDTVLYGFVAIVAMIYYKITQGTFYVTLSAATAASVLGMLLLALYAVAWGSITAPLVVRVPDFRFVLRYVLGFLYYLTPVLYATQKIPAKYRFFAEFNPLTAPVELVKYGLLGTGGPNPASLATSLIVLAVALPAGVFLLARAERRAHDRL